MEKSQLKQRRKPKQARSLQKYNAVLDATSRVLARDGYAKTTITELSHEADLPYATIYQYFENKDDIMVAWIERLIDEIYSQLILSHKDVATVNIETIETLVSSALAIVSVNKESMREMFSGMPQMLTSHLLMIMEDKTVELIHELFAEKISELDFPDLSYSLRLLTRMIIGFILQTILHQQETIHTEKDAEEISLLVSLYLREKHIEI